ncbi:hypothetical protein [Bradyrhizobium sp. Ec3.3]|uniref:hypothetical protein n=1 Tax=Bradyrhizobium sp. Ec3.3 TaxID=189753 RepID=UPI0003FB9DF7|nr:hypothetical protein [Bradyrhizobium sp. Ec3.3]
MAGKQDKLRFHRDLLIACFLFGAGVLISGLSLAQIRAESRMQTAQATPPLQGTPAPDDHSRTPAQSKPGGERPTTPAPEPAHPDPQTQGAAKPVLPQAPAEKIAPPIKEPPLKEK